MTTAMVLQQVAENEVMNIISIIILIAIVVLVLTADYRGRT